MNLDLDHFYKNKKNINITNDIIVSHINLIKNIDIYYLPYSKGIEDYFFQIENQILPFYPNINIKSKLSYQEFIISRWLYKIIIEKNSLYNKEPICILKNQDSSIKLEGRDVIFSLSHKKRDVLIGITLKSNYLGLGVDIESYIDRTYIKDKILNEKECLKYESYIKDSNLFNNGIDETIILAIYFSTKESVYKALYPIVKTDFYLKDIEILDIDFLSAKVDINVNINLNIDKDINKNLDSIFKHIESRFSIIKDHNKVMSISYF